MPPTEDLVGSGFVMVVVLAGPTAGWVLEVFVVEHAAILCCNLGLVRVGLEFFIFTAARLCERFLTCRRLHPRETLPRPDPSAGLRHFHLNAMEAGHLRHGVIGKRVLRSEFMSHSVDCLLKLVR